MANDTIKGAGDIYEKDLYGNLAKSAKEAITFIESLNDSLKKTTKINEKLIDSEANTVEELNKLNKGLSLTEEAYKSKLKLDKERDIIQSKIIKQQKVEASQLTELELKTNKLSASKAALIKKQKQADSQRRAGNEDIAKQLDLTRKERKELADLTNQITLTNLQKAKAKKLNKEQVQEVNNLTDEYQKQSKRLNELRKELKNLLLVEGKSTKETRKLQKEVDELDRTLKEVDEAAGQFQRNVGNYPDTIGKAAKSLGLLAAGAISVDAAFSAIKTSLNESSEGSESVREVTAKASGVFDQLKNVVAGTVLDVVDYGKAIRDVANGSLSGFQALGALTVGFKRVRKNTEDFTEKVLESANAQAELTKRIIEFEKSSRPLEVRLSNLNGLIEQQQIISRDSTRSFNEISAAILKEQDLQIKRARVNIQLAKEELFIASERVRIADLSIGASNDLLDEETNAIKRLIEAENRLKNEVLENEKELRQVKQDRLEIDLDILIDGFDNQKTINERMIANEKESFAVRSALLEETNKKAEQSFRGQKEVLQDLSNAGIDVDELLLLDATELAKQIQLLGQSEIINTRTLEVVRERKIVLQDLKDAEDELNESRQEGIDLRADIVAQEIALNAILTGNAEDVDEVLKELEAQREQDNIDSLERRLSLAKEGSVEFLNVQKELNDSLLDQHERRLKEKKDADKKILDEEKKQDNERQKIADAEAKKQAERDVLKLEAQKALSQKIEESFAKSSEKRQEELDNQLSASEENQNRLRELAAKGSLDAEASIAEETKKQAELKRAKEAEERKQELITSGFKIFNSLLEQGKNPAEATIETATLLSALPAIIEAIPAFFEGSENIGTTSNPLDSNGGRLILAHNNERIMTEKQNSKMGGISNDEAANVIQKYNMGELFSYNNNGLNNNLMSSIQLNGLNKGLESKIDKLNESIKAIKIPETTVSADELRNQLVISKRLGNKVEKQISRLH